MAQLSVQEGLLNGTPDRGVGCGPESLRVRGVQLQRFRYLVYFMQNLTKLIVCDLQCGGQNLLKALFCRAVLPTHGENLAVGYVLGQTSPQASDLRTVFVLQFLYWHHPSCQQVRGT